MADNLVEKSPTFEQVAADVAARTAVEGDSRPKPDMPVTIAAPAYGDPGHVNPALNPAPHWAPPPDRPIVPVQNDPGLLGNPPSLADMNRSARRIDHVMRGGKEEEFPDDSARDASQDSNREAIRSAAEARLSDIERRRDDAVRDAQDRTQDSIDRNTVREEPRSQPTTADRVSSQSEQQPAQQGLVA